ncbi:hypothetical protein Caci_9006 [Catenulispora acidiphila DSM 44928]|uniref:Uncharacterized protein n=1 Tax=Catenulispora acidiphila (strain DSM 44928 / JCM 14897 / NBRC 102108 / NRRL B-24433 / ID139908) TaxID=479433 RepID=C7Q5K8_CATAD|nr:hypothetical protein [Catenulispora acidiphila]ACU77819.1 hypothetical protein Caci_9006 [Catenulispora acidiphila DSM 44928]
MSPVHKSAVERPSFRDWCAYRVQVATESAPKQRARFRVGLEKGSRSGAWIYFGKYNEGIRIGAIESTRVEDGRIRFGYYYTAISDVHYSPAGTSAAEPVVSGFHDQAEAAAFLYGRYVERRGRFFTRRKPRSGKPRTMPEITNPAALLINFTASAAIGSELEELDEPKSDALQGVIVEIGGKRLFIYVDNDLNLHTALETREAEENPELLKRPGDLPDDFAWICSRDDLTLLHDRPMPIAADDAGETIPVPVGAGYV